MHRMHARKINPTVFGIKKHDGHRKVSSNDNDDLILKVTFVVDYCQLINTYITLGDIGWRVQSVYKFL